MMPIVLVGQMIIYLSTYIDPPCTFICGVYSLVCTLRDSTFTLQVECMTVF